MTRGISRQCSHHVHPITSLSWNRSGKKLLSSATDWNVVLWDVVSGEVELCLCFPSPVAKVQFNPRDKGGVPHMSDETRPHAREVGGGGAGARPVVD